MLIADRKSNLNIDLIARQLGLSPLLIFERFTNQLQLDMSRIYLLMISTQSKVICPIKCTCFEKEDAFINKFFCFLVKEKIIFIQIHNKIWLVWHNQAIKGYIYWLPVGLSQVTEITKKKGTICSFWFRFHFSRFPFGSNLCNRIRIL